VNLHVYVFPHHACLDHFCFTQLLHQQHRSYMSASTLANLHLPFEWNVLVISAQWQHSPQRSIDQQIQPSFQRFVVPRNVVLAFVPEGTDTAIAPFSLAPIGMAVHPTKQTQRSVALSSRFARKDPFRCARTRRRCWRWLDQRNNLMLVLHSTYTLMPHSIESQEINRWVVFPQSIRVED